MDLVSSPWALAGAPQAGRAGGSCAVSSFVLFALVGSRENLVVTGCTMSLSLPSLHPWERRGFSERVGWLVSSSSFLSFKNAQHNVPCLLRALPAAPPATRGPSTLPRNKCSLNDNTNQVSLFHFQPGTDSSLPLLWGRRREGQGHPIPAPSSRGKVLLVGLLTGRGLAPYTANSKKKLPPLPISITNPESRLLPTQTNLPLASPIPHTS